MDEGEISKSVSNHWLWEKPFSEPNRLQAYHAVGVVVTTALLQIPELDKPSGETVHGAVWVRRNRRLGDRIQFTHLNILIETERSETKNSW